MATFETKNVHSVLNRPHPMVRSYNLDMIMYICTKRYLTKPTFNCIFTTSKVRISSLQLFTHAWLASKRRKKYRYGSLVMGRASENQGFARNPNREFFPIWWFFKSSILLSKKSLNREKFGGKWRKTLFTLWLHSKVEFLQHENPKFWVLYRV